MEKKSKSADARIHKDDLVGKYIEFIDKKKGGFRIAKVVKVSGRTVSIRKAGHKKAQPVKMEDIKCNIHHGHCRREIDWNIRRKKKQEVESNGMDGN